jgi:4-hydroxybenzoate polyprenyltransferase
VLSYTLVPPEDGAETRAVIESLEEGPQEDLGDCEKNHKVGGRLAIDNMDSHNRPQKLSLFSKLWELLRFEQTLFALPIALAAALWAAQGLPPLESVSWMLLAMVGARTAGMSANRLIDSGIDASNPRTKDRLLPSGRIRPSVVFLVLLLSLALLGWSAWNLNPLCFKLCPVAFFLLLGYSYLKRFTWACHFGLGAVQACGPLGAWMAVTGSFEWNACWLALGVSFWMAGFDILYALADEEHDRTHGIHSVPGRFGAVPACQLSRLCHLVAFSFWCLFSYAVQGGVYLGAGIGAVGALLIWEHMLVGPHRLGQLPMAFFKVNSLISLVLLGATIGEIFL